MPNTREATFTASSPFILEPDMSGQFGTDEDFGLTYSGLSPEADSSNFFNEELTNSSEFLDGFQSTIAAKSPLSRTVALQDTTRHLSPSTASTSSPGGSYQDSSSESSGYKRKSSSDSSRSALTSRDPMLQDEMEGWKGDETMMGTDATDFGVYGDTLNPSVMDTSFEFNDKSMDDDFDFDSAVSSPNNFGLGPESVNSPGTISIKHAPSERKSPMLKTKFKNHNKANSVSESHHNTLVSY